MFFVGCATTPTTPTGLFARYPHSPALDATVKVHADGATDRQEWILLTTWFQGGDPRVAMRAGVRPDGRASTFRYVYDESVRDPRKVDLVADQMQSLATLLGELPPSQSPALANLLIVSVRQGGQWTTHTYDRANVPQTIAAIFALIGAPLETPGQP